MNNPKRNSGAKANQGIKQHLQTLPCENSMAQDDFKKHSGSVCIELTHEDYHFPTSPTFPADGSSLHSYKFISEKQNRPSLMNMIADKNRAHSPVNTLHESRLLRGANAKLTERNAELQAENKHLKMLLNESEIQLAKKLKEEFGYLDFFKCDNGSSRSHVDIFLELQALIRLLEETRQKHQATTSSLQSRLQELTIQGQHKQDQFAQQIKHFSQTIDKLGAKSEKQKEELRAMQNKLQKAKEHEQGYKQLKELYDEVDKQRQQAAKKAKELEEEARKRLAKISELQQQCAQAQDSEKRHEAVFVENQRNKENMRRVEKRLEAANEQKRKLNNELEEQRQTSSQLRLQLDELETVKAKLSKDISKFSSEIKSLRQQLQLAKQLQTQREFSEMEQFRTETITLKNQADHLRAELEQIKNRLEREKLEKERLQSRCNNAEAECIKLESQLNQIIKETNKEIQISRSENEKYKQELENQASESRQVISELKRRCNDLEAEIRIKESSRFNKRQDYFSNECRIQTHNEKYQTNKSNSSDSSKLCSKLKQLARTLRQCIPKQDSTRPKRIGAEQDTQSCFSEVSSLVNTLISHFQKYSRELDILRDRFDCFEQQKSFQINLKQQAIKKLIQFVPAEHVSLVSEYLFIVEQMAARCTNEHQQDKADLISQISQQAQAWRERCRILEDVERKYQDLRVEYEQIRRMFGDTKRAELPEVSKREVKKKYFEIN